jgi:hypothetical protein
MKKHLIFLLILTISSSSIYSQKSHLSFGLGYNLGFMKQNFTLPNETLFFTEIDEFRNKISNYHIIGFNESIEDEPVFYSLGQGYNISASFGYHFLGNLGAELNVSYLIGDKTTATFIYDGRIWKHRVSISSNMITINPSLFFTHPIKNVKIIPFIKLGGLVGVGNIFVYENKYRQSLSEFQKVKMDGSVAYGINTVFGANYHISKNISFFSEIRITNMSYSPTKGEVVSLKYGNVEADFKHSKNS